MSADEKEVHIRSWEACQKWVETHQRHDLHFVPVRVDSMPDPKGGVGWARKLAMDEAARRLGPDGIILCLDADCTVSENYLMAVSAHFKQHDHCDAVSIAFEHDFASLPDQQRRAIVLYELHLRYLIQAQRYTGHPFAWHTVGSSMAVRRNAYLMQGGMNTRSAGEDFYFLQKFIEVGRLMPLHAATVYPSARVSGRVPFGTGRAMSQLLMSDGQWATTDIRVFKTIRPFFTNLNLARTLLENHPGHEVYAAWQKGLDLPDALIGFLQMSGFEEKCRMIFRQTREIESFQKRFFRQFNAFWMIKYMHYMRDHIFPDVDVCEAAHELIRCVEPNITVRPEPEELLVHYRQWDSKMGATL